MEVLPEVFICGQKIPLFAKARKTHAIGVRFEHVIPAPQHISVHVEIDGTFSAEVQALVV